MPSNDNTTNCTNCQTTYCLRYSYSLTISSLNFFIENSRSISKYFISHLLSGNILEVIVKKTVIFLYFWRQTFLHWWTSIQTTIWNRRGQSKADYCREPSFPQHWASKSESSCFYSYSQWILHSTVSSIKSSFIPIGYLNHSRVIYVCSWVQTKKPLRRNNAEVYMLHTRRHLHSGIVWEEFLGNYKWSW